MAQARTGYLILLRLPQSYPIFLDEVTGQHDENSMDSLCRLPGYLIFSIALLPARPISRVRTCAHV
jgi:hypothetical protein